MSRYRIEHGVQIDSSKVTPNPWNPNKTTDREQEAIGESLKYFGQVADILVRPDRDREGYYQVIDGEHRLGFLGDTIYANVIFDLPDPEAKKLTIIMNETRGHADKIDLANLLADIQLDLAEYTSIGLPYSETELNELIELAAVEWDVISDDDDPEEPVVKDEESESSLVNLFIQLDHESHDRLKQVRDLLDNPSPDPAISWGQAISIMLQDFLAQA